MEPSALISTILGIWSVLFGITIFLLKSTLHHGAARIEFLERQISEIRGMREDIAVLKYAVMGHLKMMESKRD